MANNSPSKCLAGFKSTDQNDLSRILSLLKPSQTSLFIDIGSGEGDVLLNVARTVQCDCLGLENDPKLIESSKKNIRRATAVENCNYNSLISIVEVDAEHYNYYDACSQYTDITIYMFLSHFGYSVMGEVLIEKCPINTRIVTVVNPIDHEFWTPKCVWLGDNNNTSSRETLTLYLYVIDEDMKLKLCKRCEESSREQVQASLKVKVDWVHPPPGSYLPRPIPEDIPTFLPATSPSEILSFFHTQSNGIISENLPQFVVISSQNVSSIVQIKCNETKTESEDNDRESELHSEVTLPSHPPHPPRPKPCPPRPPPLPSF